MKNIFICLVFIKNLQIIEFSLFSLIFLICSEVVQNYSVIKVLFVKFQLDYWFFKDYCRIKIVYIVLDYIG